MSQLIGKYVRENHRILANHEMAVHVTLYSRRQYKVSVTVAYRFPTIPYFKKKRLVRPYHFILLGVMQYYCYTQSEYRAESSSMWIFLSVYCCCSSRLFLTRPFRFIPLFVSLFLLFLSIKNFSSGPFRSSPSIVSAVLVARSASVCRLFLLF